MRLRTKYILFVTIIHVITIVVSWFAFREEKIYFIISELFILLSISLCIGLYRQLLQPLDMLTNGINAIKEQDFNVKFLETGKYEMDQLITIYNQMMDKLRDERVKQEQQHFFLQKLITTSPTGIIILDYDENIQQANPKALQLLNVEERDVSGQPVAKVDSPIMKEVTKLKSGEAKTITIKGIETFKIQKSHFIDRGFARYFVMIEELTSEILAAEKKAYGKVIRMMAHEVNNTVGPVNSIMQTTINAEAKDELINDALQVAVDRNNNLNHFMRNFADVVRLPSPAKKQIDLYTIVQDVVTLMEYRAREKNVRLVFESSSQPFYVKADPQQLEQVLINIVKNSIEAIHQSGKIEVVIDPKSRQLLIIDDGKGISPEVEPELFSPFFSTKSDGQGIGLTLIRDILHNHGFEFSLKTKQPGKTVFRIYFGF